MDMHLYYFLMGKCVSQHEISIKFVCRGTSVHLQVNNSLLVTGRVRVQIPANVEPLRKTLNFFTLVLF